MPAKDEKEQSKSTLKVEPKKPPQPVSGGQDKQQTGTKREVERDLFTWTAPARPFKRRNRDFWVTAIGIVGLVGIVIFLIEGFMPVVLIISLVFLFYVMNTVEPEDVKYKVTSKGVNFAGKLTSWEVLIRFWFSRRFDSNLLIFETSKIPGRLEVVINAKDKQKLKEALSDYLPEEEAPPSYMDKAANWFSGKLPGNK